MEAVFIKNSAGSKLTVILWGRNTTSCTNRKRRAWDFKIVIMKKKEDKKHEEFLEHL